MCLMFIDRKCINKLMSATAPSSFNSSASAPSSPSSSHNLCPSCRAPFSVQNAEELPVDFTKNSLHEAITQEAGVEMERSSKQRSSISGMSQSQGGASGSARHRDATAPPKQHRRSTITEPAKQHRQSTITEPERQHRRNTIQDQQEHSDVARVDNSPPVHPSPPIDVPPLLPLTSEPKQQISPPPSLSLPLVPFSHSLLSSQLQEPSSWSSGLFSCSPNPSFVVLACCCPCVASGLVYERLQVSPCAVGYSVI